MNNLNIHILPMANPDGYEYSRKYDRHWRKNRNTKNCKCYRYLKGKQTDHCGVDLNQNWSFKFGNKAASDNPCDYEQYHGTGPFSEAETTNIKNYLKGKYFTLPD